jgi:hypothetical protein
MIFSSSKTICARTTMLKSNDCQCVQCRVISGRSVLVHLATPLHQKTSTLGPIKLPIPCACKGLTRRRHPYLPPTIHLQKTGVSGSSCIIPKSVMIRLRSSLVRPSADPSCLLSSAGMLGIGKADPAACCPRQVCWALARLTQLPAVLGRYVDLSIRVTQWIFSVPLLSSGGLRSPSLPIPLRLSAMLRIDQPLLPVHDRCVWSFSRMQATWTMHGPLPSVVSSTPPIPMNLPVVLYDTSPFSPQSLEFDGQTSIRAIFSWEFVQWLKDGVVGHSQSERTNYTTIKTKSAQLPTLL